MSARGMPWRADVHDALLAELLGPAARPGFRPPRLAELAAQISAAFGGRPVNPDSPAQLLKAFASEGVAVPSTRSGVLRDIDHPAVPFLLEYKELARLHAAHGWAWLDEWVRDGRFHPEYVVGGVVSGRWATPRRRRTADPAGAAPRGRGRSRAGCWWWPTPHSLSRGFSPRSPVITRSRRRPDPAICTRRWRARSAVTGPRPRWRCCPPCTAEPAARRRSCWPCSGGASRRPTPVCGGRGAGGEEGRVVRSLLGRTCPPPSAEWRGLTASPATSRAPSDPRARPLVAGPRPVHPQLRGAGQRGGLGAGAAGRPAPPARGAGAGPAGGVAAQAPGLVFFQHDEVIVHCPQAWPRRWPPPSATRPGSGRLVFGETPVRFPVTTAVVDCYADAK